MSFSAIVTLIGAQKIMDAFLGGTTIDLTELAVGDSTTPPTEASQALGHEVYRAAVESVLEAPVDPQVIRVRSRIESGNGGWYMREFGIFDSEGDLIITGNYPETWKPEEHEGAAVDTVIEIYARISHQAAIDFTIDPSGVFATMADLADTEDRLQVQIDGNDADIASLEMVTQSHETAISDLQNTDADLQTQIDTNVSAINDLSSQVDRSLEAKQLLSHDDLPLLHSDPGTGTHILVYPIAGFHGSGVVPDKIRGFWLRLRYNITSGHTVKLSMPPPDLGSSLQVVHFFRHGLFDVGTIDQELFFLVPAYPSRSYLMLELETAGYHLLELELMQTWEAPQ